MKKIKVNAHNIHSNTVRMSYPVGTTQKLLEGLKSCAITKQRLFHAAYTAQKIISSQHLCYPVGCFSSSSLFIKKKSIALRTSLISKLISVL